MDSQCHGRVPLPRAAGDLTDAAGAANRTLPNLRHPTAIDAAADPPLLTFVSYADPPAVIRVDATANALVSRTRFLARRLERSEQCRLSGYPSSRPYMFVQWFLWAAWDGVLVSRLQSDHLTLTDGGFDAVLDQARDVLAAGLLVPPG